MGQRQNGSERDEIANLEIHGGTTDYILPDRQSGGRRSPRVLFFNSVRCQLLESGPLHMEVVIFTSREVPLDASQRVIDESTLTVIGYRRLLT